VVSPNRTPATVKIQSKYKSNQREKSRSDYLIFGLFFQPKQYFSLATIQSKQYLTIFSEEQADRSRSINPSESRKTTKIMKPCTSLLRRARSADMAVL